MDKSIYWDYVENYMDIDKIKDEINEHIDRIFDYASEKYYNNSSNRFKDIEEFEEFYGEKIINRLVEDCLIERVADRINILLLS